MKKANWSPQGVSCIGVMLRHIFLPASRRRETWETRAAQRDSRGLTETQWTWGKLVAHFVRARAADVPHKTRHLRVVKAGGG